MTVEVVVGGSALGAKAVGSSLSFGTFSRLGTCQRVYPTLLIEIVSANYLTICGIAYPASSHTGFWGLV